MHKRKSGSATSLLDAPVSSNAIPLQVKFSNTPAPRPDGMNLWIDMDINLTKRIALFHCMETENVGTHKGRMVTYRADHDCRLKFTNPNVFDTPWVDLTENQQKQIHVDDLKKHVDANYLVDAKLKTAESAMGVEAAATATPYALAGPHIVVP